MSKTYKKPYTKSKRFDRTCRNHGSCNYCEDTRTHPDKVRARVASEKYNEWSYLEDWEVRLLEQEAYDLAAAESMARLDKSDENADN